MERWIMWITPLPLAGTRDVHSRLWTTDMRLPDCQSRALPSVANRVRSTPHREELDQSMADVSGSGLRSAQARAPPAPEPRGRAGTSRCDASVHRCGRRRAEQGQARRLLPAGARQDLLGDERPVDALDPGRPPVGGRPARIARRARGVGRQAVPARAVRRGSHHRELGELRRHRHAHVDAAPAHRVQRRRSWRWATTHPTTSTRSSRTPRGSSSRSPTSGSRATSGRSTSC